MNGSIQVGKKRIHSEWILMNTTKVGDLFQIFLADKNSDDQIRLQLTNEEVVRLLRNIKVDCAGDERISEYLKHP